MTFLVLFAATLCGLLAMIAVLSIGFALFRIVIAFVMLVLSLASWATTGIRR